MAKRKNGEGSFGQRKINGTSYKYYKFPDGHFVYGKTAADRDRKIEEYKAKLESRQKQKEDILLDKHYVFGDYCLDWVRTRKNELSGATYDNYYIGITTRVIGFKQYDIANIQLISLTEKMFEDYLKALAKVYSKGTITKTWMILKQVLRAGMKDGLIPKIDIESISTPKEKEVKVKKKVINFITPQDMERMYKVYEDNNLPVSADMIVFIMYSGARVSEAIAAKWSQVSEDFSYIKIDKAHARSREIDENGDPVVNEDGHTHFIKTEKDPKSEAGRRNIPLPDRGIKVLKKLYEQHPHNPNDLIFPNPNDSYYDRGTINRMIIKMEKLGICTQHYTPHALRHGYGSILISKGVDIKIVSELLGHADITTTYNIYIGVLKEDKINAVKEVFNTSIDDN